MDTDWYPGPIVMAVAFDYGHLFLAFEREAKFQVKLACMLKFCRKKENRAVS